MLFQMSTRLWLVSATTRWTPSEATAVGSRKPLGVAGTFSVVVEKLRKTKTTLACPTQIPQLAPDGNSAVGGGSIVDRFLNRSTRWLLGVAPTRLESATNRVSAA